MSQDLAIGAIIAVLVPIIIKLFADHVYPALPKAAVPPLVALLGALGEVFGALATSTEIDPEIAAGAGALGMLIREILHQGAKWWRARQAGEPIPRMGDEPAEVVPEHLARTVEDQAAVIVKLNAELAEATRSPQVEP